MQIEFKKENMQINELCLNQTTTLLVEGDVIVPDTCPDIREVLLTEGIPYLSSRQRTEDELMVTGGVNLRVLYLPEEGNVPCKIDAKFDFADRLQVPENASDVNVSVDTEHVEFTLINSRKLHIKVMVSLRQRGYEQRAFTFLTEAPENAPVKVRRKPVTVYQVVADTGREIAIEESLEVPTAKPDMDEIVKLSVKAQRGDCKIMAGKILLKGTLLVNTLYNSVDGEAGVEHMEHEILFSEVADVPGLSDDCLCHVNYQVQNVFYSIKDDVNGDPRVVSLDVVLRAEIMASSTQEISVIDDCYSVQGTAEVQKEVVRLADVLSEGISHENVKELITTPDNMPSAGAVYSLECKPKVHEIKMLDNKMVIKGKLTAFAVCGRADGESSLCTLVGEFDFEHVLAVDGLDENARFECYVEAQNISFSLNAASEIELRCVLEFFTRVLRKQELNLVAACDVSEEQSSEHRGLVIYFVQRGDSLWDIAKRYRTDEDVIADLNNVENGHLMPGQKLLIPRA